jgi:hypothetical protein
VTDAPQGNAPEAADDATRELRPGGHAGPES